MPSLVGILSHGFLLTVVMSHIGVGASAYEEAMRMEEVAYASAVPGATVQQALNQAIADGSKYFQFPANVAFPDSADLTILGAHGMILEGSPGGSTLWFSPPTGGFRIMSSSNLTIRRLTIDYAPLPYIQADITKISGNATAPVYTLQLVERSLDFKVLDGSLGPIVQPWLWTGQGKEKWATERLPYIKASQLREVKPRTYVTLPGFPAMPNATVGDTVTYMLRQVHTYVIGNSSNVTTEDVTTLTSLGLNFYELDGEGGHIYRRIKVTRRPGYMIGSNADCFHSIDVARGPTLVDSELGYCLDDFFNIHNTVHVLLPKRGTNRATLVNPRIGSPHRLPLNDTMENNRTLDQTYGYTSPMSNIAVGRDTLLCYAFNTYDVRFGGPLVVHSATLVKKLSNTSAEIASELQAKLESPPIGMHGLVGWWGVEVWDVTFAEGALDGWNVTAEPALMCDVTRFSASGSVIANNSFHHTTCNLGRTKASSSAIVNNIFAAPSGPNLEIKGLDSWMEGPMRIRNVRVEDNVFKGLGPASNLIHLGKGARNISISGNLPHDEQLIML